MGAADSLAEEIDGDVAKAARTHAQRNPVAGRLQRDREIRWQRLPCPAIDVWE